MPVLHPEPAGNRTKLDKSKSFIQMPGMGIALYHGIELENTESKLPGLLQAVQHQLFSDMLPSRSGRNSICLFVPLLFFNHRAFY